MKICKDCNKIISADSEDYEGFCRACYHEYLLDRIEHLGEKQPEPESKLMKFLKKFFH